MTNGNGAAKPLALGMKIREYRTKRGLSLAELAGRIKGDPTGISEIERGLVRPRESTIKRIAAALGISPRTLQRG